MSDWERAKEYLVSRFRREGVLVGTPESIARQAGLSTRQVGEALASLVGDHRIHSFQDDEGNLEYEWVGP